MEVGADNPNPGSSVPVARTASNADARHRADGFGHEPSADRPFLLTASVAGGLAGCSTTAPVASSVGATVSVQPETPSATSRTSAPPAPSPSPSPSSPSASASPSVSPSTAVASSPTPPTRDGNGARSRRSRAHGTHARLSRCRREPTARLRGGVLDAFVVCVRRWQGPEPLRRAFAAVRDAFPGPDVTRAKVVPGQPARLATLQISGRLPEPRARGRLTYAHQILTGEPPATRSSTRAPGGSPQAG